MVVSNKETFFLTLFIHRSWESIFLASLSWRKNFHYVKKSQGVCGLNTKYYTGISKKTISNITQGYSKNNTKYYTGISKKQYKILQKDIQKTFQNITQGYPKNNTKYYTGISKKQ